MKSSLLICLILSGLNAFCQDRLFLKNGLIEEGRILQTTDSSIVLEDGKSFPLDQVYITRYEHGAVKAFSGRYARMHRPYAHIYFRQESPVSAGVTFEEGYGRFLLLDFLIQMNQYRSYATHLTYAFSLEDLDTDFLNERGMLMPVLKVGVDFYKFTTLERRTRFFWGAGARYMRYIMDDFYNKEIKINRGCLAPAITAGLLHHINNSFALRTSGGLAFDVAERATAFHPEWQFGLLYNIPLKP